MKSERVNIASVQIVTHVLGGGNLKPEVHPGFLRYYREIEEVMDSIRTADIPLLRDLPDVSGTDTLRTWLYNGGWEWSAWLYSFRRIFPEETGGNPRACLLTFLDQRRSLLTGLCQVALLG